MYADLNLNSSKLEDFKPKRIFENRMLNQLQLDSYYVLTLLRNQSVFPELLHKSMIWKIQTNNNTNSNGIQFDNLKGKWTFEEWKRNLRQ